MKDNLLTLLKGFLTAYAFRIVIDTPIQRVWYESTGDFLLANVFELLGYYDFVFLLFWVVCTVYFAFMNGEKPFKKSLIVISAIFAVLLPMAQSLRDFQSVAPCFQGFVNIVKFILMSCGFFLFFLYGLHFLYRNLQKKNYLTEDSNFFTRKPFLKSFLILMAVYGIVDIICYPGNLNADTIGQIYQVYGIFPMSQHHPLVSTLLVGGLVRLGGSLFGSIGAGLFIYILVQSALLASGLALTIAVLSHRKLSAGGLWTVLALYVVTPVYTNITSTAIKDVPFMGFVIIYVVMFMLLVEDRELIKKRDFIIPFILVEISVILLRNNGLYIVAVTGFAAWLCWLKSYDIKGKLLSLAGLFLVAVVVATLLNSGLAKVLHADKAGRGDMLSLPFQTLGRYYSEFPDDFTPEETETIEKVLGPLDKSLVRYNPELADQIKAKYVTTSTDKEVMDFMVVWAKLFFRHPGAYIDGFLEHTYGWYTPVPTSEKRYETLDDDFLTPTGFAEVIDKGMVFLYRFLNRISLLGALENVGVMVWAYIFLFAYQTKRLKKYRLFGVYMLVNLLICLASPAFFEHTRYGFPILFTVPFIWAYTLTAQGTGEGQIFAKIDG